MCNLERWSPSNGFHETCVECAKVEQRILKLINLICITSDCSPVWWHGDSNAGTHRCHKHTRNEHCDGVEFRNEYKSERNDKSQGIGPIWVITLLVTFPESAQVRVDSILAKGLECLRPGNQAAKRATKRRCKASSVNDWAWYWRKENFNCNSIDFNWSSTLATEWNGESLPNADISCITYWQKCVKGMLNGKQMEWIGETRKEMLCLPGSHYRVPSDIYLDHCRSDWHNLYKSLPHIPLCSH